ncbi:competence type IV pilus minor pilin ComGG [Pseudalkalibacillus sp. SCS-8]|uniref:competence type IV pilus minor pilin ComGG n=1 Tax=Pseudalkalibacillus nanhaiensis TaxID=3115291 RepID=UPI0032DA62AE
MNQNGYMTALSVMVSLILTSVLLYNIQLLKSERAFIEERIAWFQVDVILQLAREDLLSELRAEALQRDDTGTLMYDSGLVRFSVSSYDPNTYVVRLEAELDDIGKGTGFLYYDYVNKRVLKWVVI